MKNHKNLLFGLLITIFVVSVLGQTADDDEVNAAYPGYPHKFYSGQFITRTGEKTSVIRYAFFPSLKDKTKDPLVLWLTGGPGCSSLLATFH
jgi:carboxypeptidase C (cathepsin A)